MTHRGALMSPHRHQHQHGAGPGSSSPLRLGVSDMEPLSNPSNNTCAFDTFDESLSPPRARARGGTFSYMFLASLEGLFSVVALRSAWGVTTPVMVMQANASASASASAASVHRAMRSGAALGLGMPFFLLAARVAILSLAQLGSSDVQQPRLGFRLPPGLDGNAALDLYAIGLGAAVLGIVVPSLEMFGYLLGHMLQGVSAIWWFLALVGVPPAVYFALGAWLKVSSPAEGFWLGTRPTKAMWGLCGAGHVAFLSGCFYSPDVPRGLGFLLGLVHIVRGMQQVFAYPAGAGAGMCEEGGAGVAEC